MPTDHPPLRRALGPWSTTAIVIGTVIGSGIFLVPTDMIQAVGTPGKVFFVWIFGGILSLFGALTYAELSAALPEAGGEYVYLKAAYGPLFGFLYGWTQTWVAKSASIAALATGFYTYLADFFPSLLHPIWTIPLPIGPGGGPLPILYGQLLAIGLIFFLSAVNYMGVRVGGNAQVAVTALKVALIFGLILIGLMSHQATLSHLQTEMPKGTGGVAGFFIALVAALWAYDGWNNAGMLGSEIERPERNLPIALIGGTLTVIAIYLLTNLAYFTVLTSAQVGSSARVAAEMMRLIAGPTGAAVVSIAAMISIFAALNGSILSGARVPYAMARDGYFFQSIQKVHAIHRTPSNSLLLLGAWSSVLILSGQFRQLYTMVIFPSWILYGMAAASVLVLRVRRPDLPRPYRVWGYPFTPVVFVGVAIALLYSTLLESPRESGIGLALIVLGLPFYFYWKRSSGRSNGSSPSE